MPDEVLSAERPRSKAPERAVVISLYPEQLAPDEGQGGIRHTLQRIESLLPAEGAPAIHLLPPYVTDPGDRFSIVDDERIDPKLGSWSDIAASKRSVMLDLVVAQRSRNSPEFQRFASGDPHFARFFLEPSSAFDFRQVTAPRGRKPLIEVHAGERVRRLWSSHGGEQVDLNYEAGEVFAWTVRRMTGLARRCAYVRFDGIAFAWKRSGTRCANLPEARVLCDLLARTWRALRPGGLVLAEVDAYEGDHSYTQGHGFGPDLTYNYALPPCIAAALVLEDEQPLARELEVLGNRRDVTWINIAATHDGISLRPWASVLDGCSASRLAGAAQFRGLHVQMREVERQLEPYEIDALPADLAPGERCRVAAAGYRAAALATSLLLSVRGVPFLYLPAAMASHVLKSGIRGDEPREAVRGRIRQEQITRHGTRLRHLLRLRGEHPALAASSPMRLRYARDGLLVHERGCGAELTIVHNFSSSTAVWRSSRATQDIVTGKRWYPGNIEVPARSFLWLGQWA